MIPAFIPPPWPRCAAWFASQTGRAAKGFYGREATLGTGCPSPLVAAGRRSVSRILRRSQRRPSVTRRAGRGLSCRHVRRDPAAARSWPRPRFQLASAGIHAALFLRHRRAHRDSLEVGLVVGGRSRHGARIHVDARLRPVRAVAAPPAAMAPALDLAGRRSRDLRADHDLPDLRPLHGGRSAPLLGGPAPHGRVSPRSPASGSSSRRGSRSARSSARKRRSRGNRRSHSTLRAAKPTGRRWTRASTCCRRRSRRISCSTRWRTCRRWWRPGRRRPRTCCAASSRTCVRPCRA